MKKSDLDKTIAISDDSLKLFKKAKIDVKKEKVNIDSECKALFIIASGPESGNIIFIDKQDMVIDAMTALILFSKKT